VTFHFLRRALSGEKQISGGDVESLNMGRVEHGRFIPLVFGEGVITLGSDIFIALRDEKNGTNPAALENLLMNKGLQYNGSELNDIHLRNAVSSDGASLSLTGNDRVNLQAGDDIFFLGKGNDFALGGNGDDNLSGAAGNDRIFGQSGNDKLIGGAGKDRIFGGAGNDKLLGGTGNDILKAGLGNDRLSGGKGDDLLFGMGGGDVFLFGTGSGHDRIDDYQTGLDHLKITASLPVDVIDTTDGLLFSWGEDSVLVAGIHQQADVELI